MKLPWHLRRIVDEKGEDSGFGFVRGHLTKTTMAQFSDFSADHRMLGLCSYGIFPLLHETNNSGVRQPYDPEDGWRRPYVEPLEGWAHCFREPDKFLPPGRPRELLSNSDFTDADQIWSAVMEGGRPAKRWDLIYVCYGNSFHDVTKNWPLARRCLAPLSAAGLRVLIVGRAGYPDIPDLPGMEAVGHVGQDEFWRYLARARLLWVPSGLDPSPRVIPEALCLDVPVLAYEHLLGGWKYVTPDTGAFFHHEGDVAPAALQLLNKELEPRTWFTEHFGRRRAEERLARFLHSLGPDPSGRRGVSEASRVHLG
jgi:hypothetical protein